jgi:hypothetical protein
MLESLWPELEADWTDDAYLVRPAARRSSEGGLAASPHQPIVKALLQGCDCSRFVCWAMEVPAILSTRITKKTNRRGDNAPISIIELV